MTVVISASSKVTSQMTTVHFNPYFWYFPPISFFNNSIPSLVLCFKETSFFFHILSLFLSFSFKENTNERGLLKLFWEIRGKQTISCFPIQLLFVYQGLEKQFISSLSSIFNVMRCPFSNTQKYVSLFMLST